MKYSKYNFCFYQEDLDEYALFNSRTSALILLDESEYKIFNDMDVLIKNNELKEQIYEMGFILDDDFDEILDIRNNLHSSRNNTRELSITIAPTIQCNFRCTYCYEKNNLKSSYMSEDTVNAILKFVSNKIKGLEGLHICWYGGEPLLAFDIVEKLSIGMKKLCSDNGVRYGAFMVTNGYLLNGEIASKLDKLDINGLQITIDGNEEYHNSRRFLINGKGTYRKIIDNLKENIDKLNNVSLRINIDKNNFNYNEELLEEIYSFDKDGKIFPYLGKICETEKVFSSDNCLTDTEFSNIDFDFSKSQNNLISKYPKTIANFCSADHINSFIINYNGDVYKCWSDIGDEKKIMYKLDKEGNLISENNKICDDYLLFDPTLHDKCKDCLELPLCMGGCPLERMKRGYPICSEYKDSLSKYIKEMVQILK